MQSVGRSTGTGLQLPDSHTDEIVQTEGAFAYLMLCDPGQACLNDAQRGMVNKARSAPWPVPWPTVPTFGRGTLWYSAGDRDQGLVLPAA